MGNALIICSDFPYPVDGGDKISTNSYVLALKEMGYQKIDIIAFDKSVKNEEYLNKGRDIFNKIFLLRKPSKFSIKNMVNFIIKKESFLFGRFYSNENRNKIEQIIFDGEYEVVIAIQTYIGQYLTETFISNRKKKTKFFLSTEVLHGRALEKRAKLEGNIIKRYILSIESKRADKKEKALIKPYNQTYFYAKEDEKHINTNKQKNMKYLNLALDLDNYPFYEGVNSHIIVFYGTCSWFPNEDALRYLLEDIWPVVKEQVNGVKLNIAGKNMCKWAYDYADDQCEVFGKIDNMSEFVCNADIVLAPVRIGGGIRLKILEAMAWGRPIVSTDIGMEGNEARLEVKIANTPYEYAAAINRLLTDPDEWKRCAFNARKYVEEHHGIKMLEGILKNDMESDML